MAIPNIIFEGKDCEENKSRLIRIKKDDADIIIETYKEGVFSNATIINHDTAIQLRKYLSRLINEIHQEKEVKNGR